MSIYRQIEQDDKVFGRVRKVSSGLFESGFEQTEFFIDTDELESKIAHWAVENEEQDGYNSIKPNYNSSGQITNLPEIDDIEDEQTLFVNKQNWNQVDFGDYYVNVYNEETKINGVPNENATVQFSISYGNINGYGSTNDKTSTSVTKTIYNQYKNILLGPGDSSWTFSLDSPVAGYKDRDSIYAINFSSTNLKEKFDAGNLEFKLSVKHGDVVVTETFRDDSRFVSSGITYNSTTGKVFQIIRGSILDESYESNKYAVGSGEGSGESFGFAYPDLGIIILNPYALSCHFGTLIEEKLIEIGKSEEAAQKNNLGRQLSWYGSVAQSESGYSDIIKYGTERNHKNFLKLFSAIKLGGNFKARSTEFVPSKHYFIRVRNTDFNYSNNPSFVFTNKEATSLVDNNIGPNRDYWIGRVRHEDFVEDPKTYITTVGLYNDNNELVAVAKLSVPLLKSFDSETLIKIKLDF